MPGEQSSPDPGNPDLIEGVPDFATPPTAEHQATKEVGWQFAPGQEVAVPRSDGSLDFRWAVAEHRPDGKVRVLSPDRTQEKDISAERLASNQPRFVPGERFVMIESSQPVEYKVEVQFPNGNVVMHSVDGTRTRSESASTFRWLQNEQIKEYAALLKERASG